jgi:RNA recognition motif-containing protein
MVRNLDENVTSDHLREMFETCGEIESAVVQTVENKYFEEGKMKTQVKSRGHGFVCFKYPADAKKALVNMNDVHMGENKLEVVPWMPKEDLGKRYMKNNLRKAMSQQMHHNGPVSHPTPMRRKLAIGPDSSHKKSNGVMSEGE